MKVKDLISKLSKLDLDKDIVIPEDSMYGGGLYEPRIQDNLTHYDIIEGDTVLETQNNSTSTIQSAVSSGGNNSLAYKTIVK